MPVALRFGLVDEAMHMSRGWARKVDRILRTAEEDMNLSWGWARKAVCVLRANRKTCPEGEPRRLWTSPDLPLCSTLSRCLGPSTREKCPRIWADSDCGDIVWCSPVGDHQSVLFFNFTVLFDHVLDMPNKAHVRAKLETWAGAVRNCVLFLSKFTIWLCKPYSLNRKPDRCVREVREPNCVPLGVSGLPRAATKARICIHSVTFLEQDTSAFWALLNCRVHHHPRLSVSSARANLPST